jgi:hypothetical protein
LPAEQVCHGVQAIVPPVEYLLAVPFAALLQAVQLLLVLAVPVMYP